MKKIFVKTFSVTALLGSLLAMSSSAQAPVTRTEFMLDKLRLNKGIEGIESIRYQDIQGDPYIFKDFQKASLYLVPDGKYEVDMRYDIYADQIHLRDKGSIYGIIHPEKIKMIDAGSYKFIYTRYTKSSKEESSSGHSYFILKTDGKCKLLIKKNIRIQDAEPDKLYQNAKAAKFVDTGDTYFLKIDEGNAVKIVKKKELLSVLKDKKDAVSSFISTNKLNVKDIDDLAKIVSFYNGE